MRYLVALAPVVLLAACASGQPASLERGAARQSLAPVNTLGFRPEVQATLAIPIDTAACLTNTATAVLGDLVSGARCVLNTLVPIVNPAPSSAKAAGCDTVVETTTTTRRVVVPAPQAAPMPCPPAPQRAPGCEPVASTCGGNGQSCALPK